IVALACVASAFLLVEFARAAGHLGAGLGIVRALPLVSKLALDGLVHHCLVGLDRKDRVLQLNLAGRLALDVSDWKFHFFCLADFFISLSITRLFMPPGTLPRTAMRLRSLSTMTTRRLGCVTRSTPMCPARRKPFIKRPGVVVAPLEPGARLRSDCPCVLGPPRK